MMHKECGEQITAPSSVQVWAACEGPAGLGRCLGTGTSCTMGAATPERSARWGSYGSPTSGLWSIYASWQYV